MDKKLRQVTDNIHGTIYLSELESRMMSTPFFYRLNDIYQSSTVYLTFPTNRTKRYEHCLGTLELASKMLFSATANAPQKVRTSFLSSLADELTVILTQLPQSSPTHEPVYFQSSTEILGKYFSASYKSLEVAKDSALELLKQEIIDDCALDHFMIGFYDTQKVIDSSDARAAALNVFLYQCALEALRLAALFHDAGHPPYSHVVEELLEELYKLAESGGIDGDEEKINAFVKPLGHYLGKPQKITLLLPDNGEKSGAPVHLHEQIGLHMLELAAKEVFKQLMEEIQPAYSLKAKKGIALYYITVIEFTFAILLEKSPLFKSLHSIIDGTIDADRLDFIMRDSKNSGVNWGEIPYERVIGSAQLIYPDSSNPHAFAIAFPQKVTDDIDDILVTRFKIYTRVNFHHRCVKTAEILKKAIEALTLDYLFTPSDKKAICPEIEDLWTALGDSLGSQSVKIGKWNDSWLISVLYNALITLDDADLMEDLTEKAEDGKILRSDRTSQNLQRIADLLNEVMLNHKHYFTLIKRQADGISMVAEIIKKSKITKKMIVDQLEYEQIKLADGLKKKDTDASGAARESIRRLNYLNTTILGQGDFKLLEIMFPAKSKISMYFQSTLKQAKEDGLISDFIVKETNAWKKRGVEIDSKNGNGIYLYDTDGKSFAYDVQRTLLPQLNALQFTCPWVCAYIKPQDDNVDTNKLIKDIRGKIIDNIADALNCAYFELFPTTS